MTVIIADDHPFTLKGTSYYIEQLGYEVIVKCTNAWEAWQAIKTLNPDIAILDISMPKLDGFEVVERIKANNIKTKIVFLTTHKEMSIYHKALDMKIDGYLLKSFASDELDKCLQNISEGKTYFSSLITGELEQDKSHIRNSILNQLSFPERKVFELVSQQKSTKEIAQLLFLSEKTVEAHRTNIIDKLDLPKEKNALLKFATNFQNR